MIHPAGTAAAAPLTLAVLGPLLATLHQREVELGGRRQRAVVALLVLARGHQVSTARLLDALWDGSPPPSGAATLQSSISHLRRALEPDRPPRAPSRVLVSRADGYAVPLDAANVDAWEFERLVAQAGGEPDPRARSRLLREALALWRGPALAEYAGAEWADPEVRRLEEIREVAREQLLAARLDGGETALVVPELEALLAEAPLREERWRLLALSLYRSHRQGDALATLRDARNRLAEDLGADPGPALRTLEAEVLAQSPALDAPQIVPVAAGSWDGRAAPIQPAQPGPASRPELVDREVELSELGLCLSSALEGGPRLVMIEGPAGIGKTSLLHQVRDDAARAGATVVTARGSQLERDYGFGVVRQLFDPVLAEASTREALLTGAATGARRVFDAADPAVHAPPESLFTILHGLYWLTSNLARRRPLVVAIDDVQWCDTSSLRFLGFLANRLEGLPVLVVASWRTGEQHVDDDLLHELAAAPEAVSVRPRPLSASATAELVRSRPLSASATAELVRSRLVGADDAFATACFRTTAGNPLLLRQLLRALESEGVRPDSSHADTVRAIGSRAVSSMVLLRLRRMPPAHREVARAIAVLGDGVSLPLVASLTGLSEEDTAGAVAALARSEVLRPEHPIGFVHPLVQSAVHDDLTLGERELHHERAARVLAAAGASAEQVAAQLMAVPPRGDAGVADALRTAAARAVERSAGDSATAYLRRAVLEPPRAADLPEMLMELGRLEAMGDGRRAIGHLSEAYRLLEDPRARAETAIMLARTAVFAAPPGDATRLAREAAEATDPLLVDQRQALVALERISAHMHGLDPAVHPLGPVPEVTGTGPGAQALAAALAWDEVCLGEHREEAVRLARFALERRTLIRTDPGLLWVVASIVLGLGGEDTRPFWEDELLEAYRTGGLFAALSVHLWLGFVQWQCGDLREAEQSIRICLEQNDLWGSNGVAPPFADAFLVEVLLDSGRLAEAHRHLTRQRDVVPGGSGRRWFVEAAAHHALLSGDAARALELLESVQQEMTTILNPAWRPWRSLRARALVALGRRPEAAALVTEELTLARRWGTAALVGSTLRCLGEILGPDGVATLRDAVATLARSPRRLEEARALTSLAGALLDQADADPEEARLHLRRALELAEQCGAAGLRADVAELLRRLGVRVPDEPDVRLSLTAAERRIAAMAADGAPPGDIAQALFVTSHTVQATVASVRERLGVSSPDQLRTALAELTAR